MERASLTYEGKTELCAYELMPSPEPEMELNQPNIILENVILFLPVFPT